MACPGGPTCEAVGLNHLNQDVVVPITNGAPGTAHVVPGKALIAVACPGATTCEAVGVIKNDPSDLGLVIAIPVADLGGRSGIHGQVLVWASVAGAVLVILAPGVSYALWGRPGSRLRLKPGTSWRPSAPSAGSTSWRPK